MKADGSLAFGLEQFSELRDARNGTPHHSILSCGALQVRPAQCFALAPLAKKTLRLFVKCSKQKAEGAEANASALSFWPSAISHLPSAILPP
ncbi:hypothetical protein DVJ83_05700 [Deinococcus wulumuqiensis]|uniref:Uncharacterized protein n=1 Tax=Deinococcus wulumuqiensis TaxID=980427 RepID=A0A345IGC0_9DEIO|nr:hypothetical protein DVJ83_05700 [Deinococcus wulumuqiensis]